MNLQELRDQIGDFAKDVRLNLGSVLREDGELDMAQIAGIALACSYTTQNQQLQNTILEEFEEYLTQAMITAAKAAASLMAMNNVYYRAMHFVDDDEMMQMPAKLRMNFIAKPGIDKDDFELYSLAVSAINGCELCVQTHSQKLQQEGLSKQAVQHSIRIGAVIQSAAQALSIQS